VPVLAASESARLRLAKRRRGLILCKFYRGTLEALLSFSRVTVARKTLYQKIFFK
jgi:hypothetical protein